MAASLIEDGKSKSVQQCELYAVCPRFWFLSTHGVDQWPVLMVRQKDNGKSGLLNRCLYGTGPSGNHYEDLNGA